MQYVLYVLVGTRDLRTPQVLCPRLCRLVPAGSTGGLYPARSLLRRLSLATRLAGSTGGGYSGRCRRQPPETHGPCSSPPVARQRDWIMARDPGLRGETGFRHRPDLIFTPTVSHTWASPGPCQVFLFL